MITVTIPTSALAEFDNRVEKLNKRADRLGVDQIAYCEGDTFVTTRRGELVEKIQLTFEAPLVKIAGWQFIAKLDHVSVPGSVIVNEMPGQQCPMQYNNHDNTCDHCNRKRARNHNFVIRNTDTQQYMVVGGSCLKDFVGHSIGELIGFLNVFDSLIDDEQYEQYVAPVFSAQYLLQVAFAVSERYGFVSKANSDERNIASVSIVLDHIMQVNDWLNGIDVQDQQYVDKASTAINWLKQQPANSHYIANLQALVEQRYVDIKFASIIVSLVGAYTKATQREHQQAQRSNEHLANVGDKITVDVEATSVNLRNGHYGYTTIINMKDRDGNALVWFASGEKQIEVGEQFTITGTVKKHDVFNNTNQTVLTRCKISQ